MKFKNLGCLSLGWERRVEWNTKGIYTLFITAYSLKVFKT